MSRCNKVYQCLSVIFLAAYFIRVELLRTCISLPHRRSQKQHFLALESPKGAWRKAATLLYSSSTEVGNDKDISTPNAVTGTDSSPKHSFINDDLRKYAMKLHTRDQAPKEGQQKAQTPVAKWEPSRSNYLQFLVDSLRVYETLESIAQDRAEFASLRDTGLERSAALRKDIEWMCSYDPSLIAPPACGEAGSSYAEFLRKVADESVPRFMCHYYSHYFAHTAGGRMIGKRMAEVLLEGKVLHFYQWDKDVKGLLDGVRDSIDLMALQWSDEQKQECLEETAACFRFGVSSLAIYHLSTVIYHCAARVTIVIIQLSLVVSVF